MPAHLDDALVSFRNAFTSANGVGGQYELAMYYRKPDIWDKGTPQERPNVEAGWIVVAGNNAARIIDYIKRGFEPLWHFGNAHVNPDWSKEAKGTPDQYGIWGAILSHPQGPAAFPKSQIMAYRWYDPQRCPVPGVVWPQLVGTPISEYECPACNGRVYAQGIHVARHLINTHDWTMDNILRWGNAVGLDFRQEFGEVAKREFTYTPGPDTRPVGTPTAENPAQPVVVERIVPGPAYLEAPAAPPTDELDRLRAELAEAQERLSHQQAAPVAKDRKEPTPAQVAARRASGERLKAARAAKQAAKAA